MVTLQAILNVILLLCFSRCFEDILNTGLEFGNEGRRSRSEHASVMEVYNSILGCLFKLQQSSGRVLFLTSTKSSGTRTQARGHAGTLAWPEIR
jgi:hypothetical protein